MTSLNMTKSIAQQMHVFIGAVSPGPVAIDDGKKMVAKHFIGIKFYDFANIPAVL